MEKQAKLGTALPLAVNSDVGTKVAPSIVLVTFNIPYVVDGGSNDSYYGNSLF